MFTHIDPIHEKFQKAMTEGNDAEAALLAVEAMMEAFGNRIRFDGDREPEMALAKRMAEAVLSRQAEVLTTPAK
jgi:hypothetical protein